MDGAFGTINKQCIKKLGFLETDRQTESDRDREKGGGGRGGEMYCYLVSVPGSSFKNYNKINLLN